MQPPIPLAAFTLFFFTSVSAQEVPYDNLKADAEKFFAEGSYARANELYSKAGSLNLPPSEARWVDFRLADLLTYEEPAGSLGGVYFTYDVHSFIASRADRVALLRRMAHWLAPGGRVFLSARIRCFRWNRFYGVDLAALCTSATTGK